MQEKQQWLVLEEEDCVMVVPDPDTEPHTREKRWKTKKKFPLAGLDCRCKPRVITGDMQGPYTKPMVVHNSFYDEHRIKDSLAKICR